MSNTFYIIVILLFMGLPLYPPVFTTIIGARQERSKRRHDRPSAVPRPAHVAGPAAVPAFTRAAPAPA